MTKDGGCCHGPISDLKQWSWLPPWKTDLSARIAAGICTGDPWSLLLLWSKSLKTWPHFGFHWRCRSLGLHQPLVSQPSSHAACVRAVLWLSSELFSTQLSFSSPIAYTGLSGSYSHFREAKLKPSPPNINDITYISLWLYWRHRDTFWDYLRPGLKYEARSSTHLRG